MTAVVPADLVAVVPADLVAVVPAVLITAFSAAESEVVLAVFAVAVQWCDGGEDLLPVWGLWRQQQLCEDHGTVLQEHLHLSPGQDPTTQISDNRQIIHKMLTTYIQTIIHLQKHRVSTVTKQSHQVDMNKVKRSYRSLVRFRASDIQSVSDNYCFMQRLLITLVHSSIAHIS